MAIIGTIGNIVDTLVWDPGEVAYTPRIVHALDNIYVIFCRGVDNDGFMYTVTINTNGNISDTVLSSLEFDTLKCSNPFPLKIADGVVAVAYQGDGDDGFLKTFTIDGSGNITLKDTLEFDGSNGIQNNLIHISGNIYLISYQWSGLGKFATVEIDSEGNITDTVVDQQYWDTSGNEPQGDWPWTLHLAGTNYVVPHRGPANDGFVKTFTIADNGTITLGDIDSWEFYDVDTTDYFAPIILVSGSTYALLYSIGSNSYINSLTIADNGSITKSFIDTLELEEAQYYFYNILKVVDNVYLIGYNDGNNCEVKTVTIANDGVIEDTVTSSKTIINTQGSGGDIIEITSGMFAQVGRKELSTFPVTTDERVTETTTISSDSYIIGIATISSDAYIKTTSISIINSDSSIKVTNVATINSTAYIKTTDISVINSDSFIYYADTINSDAHIKTIDTSVINSNTSIYEIVVDTINSNSHIYHTDTSIINSDSHIKITDIATIGSDSSIIYHTDIGTINSNSHIKTTDTDVINSNTFIWNTYEIIINSDSHIYETETTVINSDTEILGSEKAVISSDSHIWDIYIVTIDSNASITKEIVPIVKMIQPRQRDTHADSYNDNKSLQSRQRDIHADSRKDDGGFRIF